MLTPISVCQKNVFFITNGAIRENIWMQKNKKVIEDTFTGIGAKLGIISPAMNSFVKKLKDFGERAKKDPKAKRYIKLLQQDQVGC